MKMIFIFLILLAIKPYSLAQNINRIIGQNDLVQVQSDFSNIPEQYKDLMPAIGKMNVGCTVTHIGQGFILTAGHCFWQTFFDGELKLNQPCTGEEITWRWTVGSAQNPTSKCLEITAMQRNEELNLDFAIMKISNPPQAKILIDWTQKPAVSRILTLFSYPQEDPLSWSKYCSVQAVRSTGPNPLALHHTCDTQIGSSGAAILDAQTGKIVALHVSGDGETLEDGTQTVAVENYGLYILQSPLRTLLSQNGFIFF